MTDMTPIYAALGDTKGTLRAAVEAIPLLESLDLLDAREEIREVQCDVNETDDDGNYCHWAGRAVVAIFDDGETVWWCPNAHQNGGRES